MNLVYFEQSEEISALKLNHANREDELMKLKTEIERLKRNANKVEKENEIKMKDMKSEMQNAFKKVGEYVYENEKLQEENRTLKELKKVDDLLTENLMKVGIDVNNDSIQVVDDVENHESEESDDYPDDEEVARFFTESLQNKSSRTSPQSAAERPKMQTIREPRLGCKK